MIDSIAQAAMSLKSAEFSVAYSTAVTKKAMEIPEQVAQALLAQMLPPTQMSLSAPGVGQYIDTYA